MHTVCLSASDSPSVLSCIYTVSFQPNPYICLLSTVLCLPAQLPADCLLSLSSPSGSPIAYSPPPLPKWPVASPPPPPPPSSATMALCLPPSSLSSATMALCLPPPHCPLPQWPSASPLLTVPCHNGPLPPPSSLSPATMALCLPPPHCPLPQWPSASPLLTVPCHNGPLPPPSSLSPATMALCLTLLQLPSHCHLPA